MSATIRVCERCGQCCRDAPCLLAVARYGLHSGPCRALRERNGVNECGIYADAEGLEREVLRLRLAIGFGCMFKESEVCQ
jgi:hypothetical protein